MRNPNFLKLATLIAGLALVACGPNTKELAGAKSARYKGDKLQMFAAIKTTTEAKYHIEKADETTLGLQTVGRWYTPEGLAAGERNDDMRDVPDKSLRIALVVTMQADGDTYLINVKPLMIRYIAGSPKPEAVAAEDPSVPGWASGKVDELAMDIHGALAAYEVKGVPQSVPPPANNMPPAQPGPTTVDTPASAPGTPAP